MRSYTVLLGLIVCLAASACRSDIRRGRNPAASAPPPSSTTQKPGPAGSGGPGAVLTATPGSASALAAQSAAAGAREPEWPARFPPKGLAFVPVEAPALKGTTKSILCQGRKPCRVLEERDAGSDAKGVRLSIVAISLHAKSRDPAEPPPSAEDCEPIEHWLVQRTKAGIVEVEKLLESCNDGYGAAGVGEDEIDVRPNRFGHSRSGGSSWRWDEGEVLQLSPRRIVEQSSNGFWTLGPNRRSASWNWDTFSGFADNFVPVCDASGAPPENWDAERPGGYIPIPVVDVEGDFAASGWKETDLGACAARVAPAPPASDSAPPPGFLTHGEYGGAGDSQFEVVGLPDGSFIVEVHDDRFVLKARRPLFEDHLEVWLGEGEAPSFMTHCEEKPREKPQQWGIRLADGAVFSGFGSPAPDRLRVEVGSRENGVRLRVHPREAAPLVTFVYSDSDDGLGQKALIGTSRLAFGNIRSLGATLRINPKNAHCRVQEKRLEPVVE